jgi:hypothetical protein
MGCRVYEKRPGICRECPKDKVEAADFKDCTFFTTGCRLDCRECCIDMFWDNKWERGYCRYSYGSIS